MGALSPAFRSLDLESFGLEWVPSPIAVAHPLDDGRVGILARSSATHEGVAAGADWARWKSLFDTWVRKADRLFPELLAPVHWPTHPFLLISFARYAVRSCQSLVSRFEGATTRALLAGNCAHSFLSLDAPGSAAIGIVLTVAGRVIDWSCARGGSQAITNAIAARARSHGCEIRTRTEVRSLHDLPPAKAVVLDVTPRQVLAIAGQALSPRCRRWLESHVYGLGAFKLDYVLSEPIPWRNPQCCDAAMVHVGGTYEEIARGEADVSQGNIPERPFVLVAQQSRFDRTRAPTGYQTGWAYCHVPPGSAEDMTGRIEKQIERFAPGFRDVVIARHVMNPAMLEHYNPNLVGGDICGGANTLSQRVLRTIGCGSPYTTSDPRLFMCSSSTPPGAGVHGMCGFWAARSVLRRLFPALDRH
jgi:phytoene dehydrogenase-like protein